MKAIMLAGALGALISIGGAAEAAPTVAGDLQALTGASCFVPAAGARCVVGGQANADATGAFNALIASQIPPATWAAMRRTLAGDTAGGASFTWYKGPTGLKDLIGGACATTACDGDYVMYKIEESGAIGVTFKTGGVCKVAYMASSYAEAANIC